MTATKHRVAAGVLFLFVALAILGTILQGVRLDWDLQGTTGFGRSNNSPFWFSLIAFGIFSLVMAVGAVWQLRLASRK